MKAKVSNIQRYSVNDGYGIRSIVFLVGCSMRCAWCQNPETIESQPALMYMKDNCVRCGACIPACPMGVNRWENGEVSFDRTHCKTCFACAEECFFEARKPTYQEMETAEVFAEVMKDEAFFRNSGGGLTLSGGEPLLQPEFCRELLRRVKEKKLHTAIETAGNVPYTNVMEVLPFTDLFLYDIKMIDEEKHKRWTGVSNRKILENLKRLAKSHVEIIIRVPLVAGVNDGDEFEAIVDFVLTLPHVRELHILPYHTIGESKYQQLGMEYETGDIQEENDDEVERCRKFAEDKGLRVSVGGAGFSPEIEKSK